MSVKSDVLPPTIDIGLSILVLPSSMSVMSDVLLPTIILGFSNEYISKVRCITTKYYFNIEYISKVRCNTTLS